MPVVWHLFTREEVATVEIPDDSRTWLERADPEIFRGHQNSRSAIRAARERDWKILPGMTYIHQATKIDGVEQHFRSVQALIDICHKHAMFPQ